MLLHSSKSHAHGQQSANRPACADSGQACRQRPHQLHRRNVVRNVRPIAAATIDGEDVPHLFVFGMGYTASAVASYLRHVNSSWRISGTVRQPHNSTSDNTKDWGLHLFDPATGVQLSDDGMAALQLSTHVLLSIPPLAMAMYDPALSAQLKLLSDLQAAPPGSRPLHWVGYLSSTAVYGDWQGEWVDESSECRLTSSRALLRKEAEDKWRALHDAAGLPVHVFRLGGIYGPGRSALESVQQEAAQSLSSSQQRRGRQKYTARVHVYDIAATVCASMQQPRPGAVYNIVDDDPAPRGEVMAYTRALLQAQMGQQQEPNQLSLQPSTAAETHEPLPAAQAADLKTCSATAADSNSPAPVSDAAADAAAGEQSPEPVVSSTPQARGRRSGGEVLDEKRVRNALIKTELGMQLRYPTYREGIAALVAADRRPFH